mmetsp:Transcript_32425/g.32721  ORF Transcript_32425/g.32721 Transcript_32425/m.32721 type:complete len:88 (-) Transcript_32425:100-363(-)
MERGHDEETDAAEGGGRAGVGAGTSLGVLMGSNSVGNRTKNDEYSTVGPRQLVEYEQHVKQNCKRKKCRKYRWRQEEGSWCKIYVPY